MILACLAVTALLTSSGQKTVIGHFLLPSNDPRRQHSFHPEGVPGLLFSFPFYRAKNGREINRCSLHFVCGPRKRKWILEINTLLLFGRLWGNAEEMAKTKNAELVGSYVIATSFIIISCLLDGVGGVNVMLVIVIRDFFYWIKKGDASKNNKET